MTTTTFSRKTIAIALAAGMTLGAVTVATPMAGAVAGYDKAVNWKDSTGGNDPNNLAPITWKDRPTWGSPMEGSGGVYTDVPTSDGLLTGFSGVYGGYTAGTVAGGVEDSVPPYGSPSLLRDMKTAGMHPDAPERDMSMDSKKMLYVAYSFVNDIVKNQGLSQEAQDALIRGGYKGEFYDELTMSKNYWSGSYDDILVFDKKPTVEEVRGKATTGNAMVITKADYVAFVASYLAGSVYSLDGGNNPIRATRGDDRSATRPLTFGDMYDRENFAYTDYDKVNTDNDRYSMAYAMINIARGVSDEEVNKADLKVYKNPDFIIPPLFSISNSSPAPVEDLPQAPTEDIYISDVKKLPNGNYEVTRNDGEKWIIDLSDLNKAKKDIEGLKSKDEATQKEIDKIKEEITKLENSTIKEVKDNGDGTYTLIRKDGSKVPGKIDTSGSVTNVKTDGKGNLIITIDGKDKTVPLAQTTIKEANKGTPNHTVTITSPNGDTVTFNVFDKHVTDVKKLPNGNYEVTRNDGTKWTINLKDIRDKIAELEKKESPSKDEFDKLKQELADLNIKVDNEFKNIDNRFNKVEGDITNLRSDLTKLENRVTKIEARLTKVEGRTDALTKCVAGAGMAGIPALLSVPLMLMTQLNIPGIKDLNTQIQKQIGIYNPELARQWERNGGVLQAGATLAGLAGMIGGIAYIANQCDPMMQSDAAKETDLGQLSSKLEDAKAGSSKPEDKDKGSSVDAGSSNRESTGEGSSTEAGSSTDNTEDK